MADVKVEQAAKELAVSKFWLYKLPRDTPGKYFYGRALRINVLELRHWAREQAMRNHEESSPST